MKKALVLASSLSLFSTVGMAAMPVYQPIGSSFTLSNSVNQRALATALGNPAAPFLMVNQQAEDSFRFGILGPLGVGGEVGDIGDLTDQIDKAEKILDAKYTTIAEAQAGITEVNAILNNIAATAYAKVSASTQVPLMPVIYKTKANGAFMLDASVSAVGRGSLLADDITAQVSGTGAELVSNTSLYVKSATDLNVGLGYSQSIWKPEGDQEQLIGGAKVNIHRISLGKSFAVLTDSASDSDDISLSDDDAVSSTGVGLDLGVIWIADHYQVGLTLANINEPEFDYGAVGTNCGSKTGSAFTSCNAAASFVSGSKLSISETYTMEMQTTVDAAVTSKNKSWTLSGSYDVNSVLDPLGDAYQWGAISVSYYGDSHFIPGLRAGYRQNMAGSELSYVTAGLTLLKRFNLDVAVSTQTVKDTDGDEHPRSAYISLGYGTAF